MAFTFPVAPVAGSTMTMGGKTYTYSSGAWRSQDASGNQTVNGHLYPSTAYGSDLGSSTVPFGAAYVGDLVVGGNTNTSPDIIINGAAGSNRRLRYQTAGVERWRVQASSTAEGGSDAGSDFNITAYDDSGTALGSRFAISRATGAIMANGTSFTLGDGTGTSRMYLNGVAGEFRTIIAQSGGAWRWAFGADTGVESGSSFGSNFVVRRYDDSGAYINTAFSINRGTGDATFTGDIAAGDGTGLASFSLNGGAGNSRKITIKSGGVSRWQFGVSSAVESGSNLGSDFYINRYNDSGAYLGVPLVISRETGMTTINSGLTSVISATIGGPTAATARYLYLDTNNVQTRAISYQTNGVDRWWVRANNIAEPGTGAGSDFEITRFDDSGTSQGLALNIARLDGTGTFAGIWRPGADNTYSLGAASRRWSVVYSGTGAINTSDRNQKQDVEELSDAEVRVAARLKGLVRKFRFKDAVATKGADARIHIGVIAQDVADAFNAEGLDGFRYGLLCRDVETREDGTTTEVWGVRYEELLAFVLVTL